MISPTWKSSMLPQSFLRLQMNDWNIESRPALGPARALNWNSGVSRIDVLGDFIFTWQMSWLEGLMKVFNSKRTRIRIIGNRNWRIKERGFLQKNDFTLIHNEFSNYNLFFRIQCFFTQRKKCLDIVNHPILTSSCVGEWRVQPAATSQSVSNFSYLWFSWMYQESNTESS